MGEHVEIQRNAKGDYQWNAVDAGNHKSLSYSGEGFVDLDYAVKSARERNPGLAVRVMDEQGGVVEEFRPIARVVPVVFDPAEGKPDPSMFLESGDAMVWAEAFVAYVAEKPEIATDPGTMVGWFANAMAADARARQRSGGLIS